MDFTIRIKNSENELSKKLVAYLKSLADTKEYDFLQVLEDDSGLTDAQKEVLDQRLLHFSESCGEYANWEDIKDKLSK